jgi:hypothetical protein
MPAGVLLLMTGLCSNDFRDTAFAELKTIHAPSYCAMQSAKHDETRVLLVNFLVNYCSADFSDDLAVMPVLFM